MSDTTLWQALELMDSIDNQGALDVERVSFEACSGRILAEDLVWDRNHPPYDRAAMDGFAFPSTPQIGKRYPIQGLSRAGEPFMGEVLQGQCIRIATGAVVPSSCQTVVQWEKTKFTDQWVEVQAEISEGSNIHQCGSDHQHGSLALEKGTRLSEKHFGLLATIGVYNPLVLKKLGVSLLCTGSELVSIEAKPEPHQIRASNFYLMKGLLSKDSSLGLQNAVFLEDQLDTLLDFMEARTAQSTLTLVTGGVGTSEFDLVPKMAQKLGFKTLVHGLAIKPGHPLFLAQKEDRFILGLPGNPVSSVVCYQVFGRYLIRKLLGLRTNKLEQFNVTEDLKNKGRRLLMRPVWIQGSDVKPVFWHGSGDVSAIHRMNGLAFLEPETTLRKGESVQVLTLEAM